MNFLILQFKPSLLMSISYGLTTVAFSIVRQENMYDNDNQKLLFPVT